MGKISEIAKQQMELGLCAMKLKNTPKPDELPDTYVNCLLKNKNGTIRVGRLSTHKNCWLLSSYQMCKAQWTWSLDEVIKWEVIKFTVIQNNNDS